MAKPVTTMEGTMLLGGIDFGCRGTFFCWGCPCCISGWLQWSFSHECNINALSDAIGGIYFDHVSTGII